MAIAGWENKTPTVQTQQPENPSSKKKPANLLGRYSGMAGQMGHHYISAFALLGQYFDEKWGADEPYFTIVFCLFGLIGSFVYFYKELMKKDQ